MITPQNHNKVEEFFVRVEDIQAEVTAEMKENHKKQRELWQLLVELRAREDYLNAVQCQINKTVLRKWEI
jgi:hypothetical protein